MKLTQLYRDMRPVLVRIEAQLKAEVAAEHPDIKKASLHLLNAGGKRIRPVFVMLAGRFGQQNQQDMMNVAVALEMIHMASLVHDDVVDDSDMRRGRPTIKSKWDNRVAMYTGDFLFAGALKKVTDIKNPTIQNELSRAMVQMSIGEIVQMRSLFAENVSLRDYLRRIKRKTALLIAVSCKLGAVAGGAPERDAKYLYQFGYYVGMSFQIMDDVLDFTESETQLGKPAGSDLWQGNLTLPTLYALHHTSVSQDVLTFLRGSNRSPASFARLLEGIRQSGGIEYSRHLSHRYLQKAYDTLLCLPASDARHSLFEIAKYMGERHS